MEDFIANVVALQFFLIPIGIVFLFIASLCRFISALVKNKTSPGKISKIEIFKRLMWLVTTTVFLVILIIIVIGFISIVNMEISFM